MPHRTFDDGFYSASRARDIAAGNGAANSVVLLEINALQEAIDAEAKLGNLSLEAGIAQTVTTTMSTSEAFREAFLGQLSNEQFAIQFPGQEQQLLIVQMERVIGYFTRLGYSVKRRDIPSGIPPTFDWVIKW